MAQESPSRILYAQAAQMLQNLQQIYSTTKAQTPEQISLEINNILNRFASKAGRALTEYDPIVLSEVPISSKMNRFWFSLEQDLNILQDQIDILRASSIFSHNFTKTEVLKAKRENARLQNKLKTLEIYSAVDNAAVIHLGDSFITEDFIDWDLVSASKRATLLGNGYVSLKVASQSSVISSNTTVQILNGSNGFIGNNQEINDPSLAIINPANGQKMYTFKSEINKAGNLKSILDQQANTWFEFEKYLIPATARAKAKNLNFDYILTNDPASKYLLNNDSIGENSTGAPIPWANGLQDGILKLKLEIDLGIDQQANTLSFSSFGLTDNSNNPIKITRVSTSLNHTDWSVLNPENVWIANSLNRQIASLNTENVLVGSNTYIVDGETIRYIRLEIEQPKPIDCNIGHLYYVINDAPSINIPNYTVEYPAVDPYDPQYDEDIPYNAPIFYGGTDESAVVDNLSPYERIQIDDLSEGTTTPLDNLNDLGYRLPGPNPPVSNPQEYMHLSHSYINGLIQKKEFFKGKRWVIGIRDVDIKKNLYDRASTLVSKKFNIPGIVDRVALEADVSIPSDYDSSWTWIRFFISPNNGLNWYQISRIQDDFLDIPEIIAFNDPTPQDLREPGVGYYDVSGTVNSLRVKIEISRPENKPNSTPIVRSYRLKIIKRD